MGVSRCAVRILSWREGITQLLMLMAIMALHGALAVCAQGLVYLHCLEFSYQFSKVDITISQVQLRKQCFPPVCYCIASQHSMLKALPRT